MALRDNQDARDALEAAGFLHSNGRLRRTEFVDGIRDYLIANTVVSDVDDVEASAATLDDIGLGVVGHTDEDIRALMTRLCSPGHNSAVQASLNGNGHMLCATRVGRSFPSQSDPNKQITRHFSARFISDDAAVTEAYLVDPIVEKVEKWALDRHSLFALAVKRQPALESAARRALDGMHRKVRAELSRPVS